MTRTRLVLLPAIFGLVLSVFAAGSANLVAASTLAWNAPADGATSSGTVTFKISVPTGTAMVYYKVNETRVAIVKQAPFTAMLSPSTRSSSTPASAWAWWTSSAPRSRVRAKSLAQLKGPRKSWGEEESSTSTRTADSGC